MARPSVDTQINMDEPGIKRRLMTWIGSLKGIYRICIEPERITISNQQRKYWWAAICTPLAREMSAQGGIAYTKDDAHAYLKLLFLPKTFTDPRTGEVIRLPGSIMDLNKPEASEAIEKAIAHCQTEFNLPILSREEWGWIPDKKVKAS